MSLKAIHILRKLVGTAILFAFFLQANAHFYFAPSPGKLFFDFFYLDPTGNPINDTLPYPIHDRYGDPYTYPNRNPFYLQDTSFVKRNVIYDPATKQYYIEEKIGSQYYRTPMGFSMQDFINMQGQKDEEDYFRKRADLLSNMNRRTYKPKFQFFNNWVNRITGNGRSI